MSSNSKHVTGVDAQPRKAITDASLKRLVNNDTVDVNQIMPIKYDWAWEHYQNEQANHWLPQEVPMADDVAQWRSTTKLTDAERLLIKRVMGFFSSAEGLVANNLTLAVFRFVSNPEARMYILRQALTEAIHQEAMVYIIESLGLDEAETFGMYAELESIRNKDEFEMRLTNAIVDPAFTTQTEEGLTTFVKNLFAFYVVLEGLFFYGGFAMIEALRRQNKMVGMGQQFEYIRRDEAIHTFFGIDLINGILDENPHIDTPELRKWMIDTVEEAVELEHAYTLDVLPEGFMGFNSENFMQYFKYLADRRFERLGMSAPYGASNPFPWMSESFDLGTEANFFERRVIDYRKGASLEW